MRKVFQRLCSIVLVIVMVVNLLPADVLAQEVKADASAVTIGTEVTESKDDSQPVKEIMEKRTEYTKQFRLDNGLYMAAVYSEPIHYREDGEWKDIDNTLQIHGQGTRQGYTNTNGIWDVHFPQQMTDNDQISITKDGYTISFGMEGELNQEENGEAAFFSIDGNVQTYSMEEVHAATAEIQPVDLEKQKEASEFEEMVIDKLASKLLYEDVYDNTSVQYELNSNMIKESVIINEYSSTLRGYSYTLDAGELIPVLEEDGHIDFYAPDMESVIMVMPAPFLVDDSREHNFDVQVQLTGSDSEYTLTYLLPQEWLGESNRAWPVVLDPVVTAKLNTNNILDRTIAKNYTYSETAGTLECGYRQARGLERIFLKYAEIPELKGSETVVEACISMYKPEPSAGSPVVEVHKVNSNWHSSTITWSNQPAHNYLIEDYCIVTNAGYYTWDVTDIVRDWYSGSNTGMMFRVPSDVEAVTSNSWEQFYSSDYSEYYNLKPALYISYRNNNGIEPYYTYQTLDAGHAGIAYISDSTGQLKVVKPIAEYASTVNPFQLNLVYNSDYFAANASASDNIQSRHSLDMLFGNGFTLDIIQSVKEAELENAVGRYLVYHDGDGTDHYFAKQTDGTYKDEDGLNLTISGANGGYTMTDKQGNTWIFKQGILSQITDETGNMIWINYTKSSVGHWFYEIYQRNKGGSDIEVASVRYTGVDSYVKTLTDAAGRIYTFTYASGKYKMSSYNVQKI